MPRLKFTTIIDRLFIMFEIVLLIIFLFWHLKLGLVRYFDIDEFAHIHWAYNFFSGMKPYSGFLYFFPPGFLLVLYPLFIFFQNTTIPIAARILEFAVFFLLILVTIRVAWKARGIRVAILSAVVLAFLPLPFDKFVELRPDTMATVLSLAGILFLMTGIQTGRKAPFFISGLLYGLAITVLTKVVFFLPAAFLALFLYLGRKKRLAGSVIPYLAGFFIPMVLMLVIFAYSGNFGRAVYLITTFASTSSRVLANKFPMLPNLFFYPNDVYYGEPGISLPIIINLIIYIVAVIWGICRFVTFLAGEKYEDCLVELLMAASFLVNLFAFVKIFPLKHAQYLIAFAPFVAFYFADFIYAVLRFDQKRKLSYILLAAFLLLIGMKGVQMNQIKASWRNNSTDKTISRLIKAYDFIPGGEYVWDLVGETVSYKDPYYICCLPYGQYNEAFLFRIPNLEKSLRSTQTKYIYADFAGRLEILPYESRKFVKEHYLLGLNEPDVFVPGVELQFGDGKEKKADLVASGHYRISGTAKSIMIDNKFLTGDTVYLNAGVHMIKGEKGSQVTIKLVK